MCDAFWSKVGIVRNSDCWPWNGAKNAKGYGNFRSRSAHRVAYELAKGPIPAGLTIDHTCRNRSCVNPDHLEAVTLQENIRRHSSTITHCKHGHPLSGDNVTLYKRADGLRRKCRKCKSISRKKERNHDR